MRSRHGIFCFHYIPKVWLLRGEVGRDQRLTREEATRLIAAVPLRLGGEVLNALRSPISLSQEVILHRGLSRLRPRSSGGSARRIARR